MNKSFAEDEIRLGLLKQISDTKSYLTQRDLACHLGISLGKTNYCLNSLIEKGYVKATRFKNSRNKAAYAYVLTPRGIEQKLNLLVRFLRQKESEYRMLAQEVARLRQEVDPQPETELPERP